MLFPILFSSHSSPFQTVVRGTIHVQGLNGGCIESAFSWTLRAPCYSAWLHLCRWPGPDARCSTGAILEIKSLRYRVTQSFRKLLSNSVHRRHSNQLRLHDGSWYNQKNYQNSVNEDTHLRQSSVGHFELPFLLDEIKSNLFLKGVLERNDHPHT